MFFLLSCNKEKQTNFQVTLTNKTNQLIKVYFYNSGLTIATDSINLLSNIPFLFADGYFRGIVTIPQFIPKYSASDSIVVVFNNFYRVNHNSGNIANTSTKFYPRFSTRNVRNPASYIFTSKVTTKNSLFNEHFYEFTEADYQFARE